VTAPPILGSSPFSSPETGQSLALPLARRALEESCRLPPLSHFDIQNPKPAGQTASSANRPVVLGHATGHLKQKKRKRKKLAERAADLNKEKEGEADLKEERTGSFACVFGCFAGNGVAHSRQKGEEGRKPLRISPRPLDFAAAREPTRRQWRGHVEEMRRHCSNAQKPSSHSSCRFQRASSHFPVIF